MKQVSLNTAPGNLRVFTSCLLSFAILITPVAAIAASDQRSVVRDQRSENGSSPTVRESANAAGENTFLNPPIPKPAPEPLALAPVIVATKDDGLAAATTVAPGGTITYTVNIQNNGAASPADDATNVQFSDTIDAHTTLVANSPVAAVSDKYNTIGNTQISVPNGATDLLGNDFDPPGDNTGMTVTAYGATTGTEQTVMGTATPTAQNGSVTVNSDGSFTYDPPLGFEGTDTFKYRAADVNGFTAITTVKITIAGMIWYVNNNAGACTSSCDGRLSHPFQTLAAFQAVNNGTGSNPAAGDSIFLYESATAYVGPVTLLNTQKFIGQDATASLASITGFTAPSGADPFPVMNTGAPATTITGSNANGINLGIDNTLRGFTVGNTGTGTKISGISFGTLIVGNSGAPDVTLNGTGQALNLSTGVLSVAGGFVSVATTSSAAQGISFAGISDSGAGSFSFGSTTVSGSTTQGILIGTTTADLNLGNTSVTGGTDGVSFQNNSSGLRTIGTLNVTGGSGRAFLHGAGGGNVTVTGAATLSSTNSAVDVSAPGATNVINFQAATSATSTGAGNAGVNWVGTAGASITFNSLTIDTNAGTGLNATTGGTVNVTNATGTINSTPEAAPAIVANAVALNTNFAAINSSGGTNGVSLTNVSGTSSWNGGSLTGTALGATFNVSGGTVSVTYSGGITQASNAAMVFIGGGHTTGTITFQTGTLSATNGTGLQFDNADSTTSYNFNGTTTLNGGDAGIDILNGSGGTFNFASGTAITNPSGTAFYVNASAPTVTMNGTVSQNAGKRGVFLENNTGGSTTFTGTLNLSTTTANAFEATHTSLAGTVTVQTAAANVLSTTSGTALRINNVNIGANDVTFQSISANGAGSGIILNNTGSSGGLNVTGTGTTDGTGGTIQNTTGDAVSLTTTRSVVLKNMIIGDNAAVHTEGVSTTNSIGDDGISCTSVTPVSGDTYGLEIDNLKIARTAGGGIDGAGGGNIGLHVNNTEIINPGDAGTPSSTSSDEDAIGYGSGFAGNADQLTGTALIENSTFAAFIDHGIQIENAGSGTLNMTVSNVTIKNNDGLTLCSGGPCEGSAIQVIADGSTVAGGAGPTIALTVRQLTVTNIDQDGIDAIADPGGNIDVTVGDPANNATNGITFNCPNGDQVLRFNSGSPDSDDNATFDFNVRNVIVQQSSGTLVIFKAANSMTGKFINSTLDQNNATATSLAARGIEITADGDASTPGSNEVPSMTILIDNVTLNRIGGDGIQAFLTDVSSSSSRLDLTIQNCNIGTNPANTAQTGLEIGLNNGLASEGIEIRNGVTTGANGQLYANINNNNFRNATALSASAEGIDIDAEFSTTSHVTVTNNDIFAAPGTTDYDLAVEINTAFMCADFTGNNDSNDATSGADITNSGDPTTDFQIEGGSASLAGNNPGTSPFNLTGTFGTGTCTMPNVPTGAFFALNNQSNQQIHVASQAQVANELPAAIFASAENALTSATQPATPAALKQPSLVKQLAHVMVHSAADVHSLIASSTPAVRDSSAAHHAESAIKSHESVNTAETAAHDAAVAKLETRNSTSEVRAHHAPTSRALTAAPVSGETVTANIGTLPAGGSATITFQVTVNNPPNLTLLTPNPRVENQGTVTFNEVGSPVLTDDPTVGGATDKTATRIDLFDTTTTLASNLNPSNFGDSVTFTATINETPAQGTADPTGTVDFIDTNNGNAVICNDVAVTAGSAQCITSALAAGTHDMQAVYSGDGNFEGSNSNIVSQVVVACTANPVVTSIADNGAGTLREALANVCGSPSNVVTFNIAGSGPHTITLTTGELAVAKNVVINNNSGESVTVTNATGRAFNINSGKTAAIIGLTITGNNSAGDGGAIVNDGALTIINSTLTGSTSSSDGGAISTTATGTALTLINTTISGNSAAGSGGGLITLGGTVSIINSTFSNNTADSDNNSAGSGGGIRAHAGTVTLKNTIVAGNFNEDGLSDAADDISGTVDAASSFNLIGDAATAGGLTNGVNSNQVGVAAGLGALAGNGGTTQTHALLSTSLAIETGSNANLPADTFDLDGDANVAEALPVDQRGTGFPRNADSADVNTTQTVDIGAFELHPSIEDITDKTTAEDTAVPQITFNLGDGTGSLIASVTATSGNTTLVPNANILVGGSGSTRTLDITPAADANSPSDGTATITVTVTATNGRTAVDTFVVTVTEVNDAPAPTADTIGDIGEDCSSGCTSGKYVIPFATLLANDTNKGAANESGQTVNITAVSSPTGGTVAINGTDVEFTPTADFFGAAGFTYTVTDNGTTNGSPDAKTGNATVSFNITAVNDNPVLATNTGITVNEASTNNTITSAMLNVTDVDNTPSQITYTVGTAPVNGTLKKSGGALAGGGTFTQADINGNLITYDHDGSDTTSDSFTFTVSDGAGGSIGLTTFNITITPQNDAPVVTAGGTLNYTENDAATAIDTTITVTDSDSANLASATAQITGNYVNGEDVLSFTNTASITGIFNAGSGTLTLSGSDTVANYQTALRAVKYNNTSENPSTAARTVSWIANDGSLPSSAVTSTINVTSVNDAPVNTVPGPQGTNQNTPLTFSSGSGNQISVADVDAGTADIRITLTASNGTITLSTTSGLNFGCGGCGGDGTADATMTFEGTLTEVNTAMNGMTFNPTTGFSGAASLTITSNDLGNTGTTGAKTDTDVVNIQVSTNINVQDATVAEPSSGTTNMIFTVTLSAPAPAGGTSVNYQTSDGTAKDGVGEANQDYTASAGTVNFAAGEQLKTISVPVLSDSDNAEVDETFTVTLSSPVNGTIADGTATGTITVANPAGTLLISEFRQFGPGPGNDPLDDFVEIYNNTGSPIVVPAGGYGLFKMGADCNATPVLIGTIPAGTNIPARGHFLFTGPIANYSLKDYGGTNAAANNALLTADLGANENFGLFGTTDVTQISSVNRFDAVGFGLNNQGVCDLLREGSTLTPLTVSSSLGQHSYFRKMCDWIQNQGCTVPGVPKDTNQNLDDFWVADTAGSVITGRLGAPGPENLGSPIRRDNTGVNMFLLDSTTSGSSGANRDRNGTAEPNASFGTMTLRYRVANNTGASVTRLRYRIVDISTAIAAPGPTADLRALTGVNEPSVGPVHDPVTCAGPTPCNVFVNLTTLEQPPTQSIGGGYNSTLSSGTITTGTPLPNGQSILINFKLGVEKTGQFRFYIIIEALP